MRPIICVVLLMLGVQVVSIAQTGGAPVGVMSYAFPEYTTTSVGVPLLRPSVLTRVIGSVAGTRLTFTGVDAGTGSLPPGSDSYYLEVLGHLDGTTTAMVGHRFEVDEEATRAAGAGIIVLDVASALNTSSSAAVSGLANYRVAVRPHWSLAGLFGTGSNSKFNAAASLTTADQVFVWDGTGFSVFYFRSGDVAQWRNSATGATNQDGAIVPPGVGIYVKRQAGAVAISVVGEVRTNRFVRAPYAESQLLASGFPVDSSPADWKLLSGVGFTAGTGPTAADQLLTWAGSAFDAYYLRDGAVPQWRNMATGLTDFTNSKIVPSSGAALLLLRSVATGSPPAQLVQATPFSL